MKTGAQVGEPARVSIRTTVTLRFLNPGTSEGGMKRVFPCVFVLLLVASAARAQLTTGNIIGVVKDESGGALPGVTATMTSPALPGGPAVVTTGASGDYRFTALP